MKIKCLFAILESRKMISCLPHEPVTKTVSGMNKMAANFHAVGAES